MGAGARAIADGSSNRAMMLLEYSPLVAQWTMVVALIVLIGLTAHRFIAGPPDDEDVADAPEE